jgi:hypothetical protein
VRFFEALFFGCHGSLIRPVLMQERAPGKSGNPQV